jgi:hypothetical protein
LALWRGYHLATINTKQLVLYRDDVMRMAVGTNH